MGRLLTKLMPQRRWIQFSLRTGLLLVSAICVALCLWVVPAERQRRAVAAIEALRGSIEYAERDQSTTDGLLLRCLRQQLRRDYFDEVCGLWFTDPNTTDAHVAQIQGLQDLPKLESLVIADTSVTGYGLVNVEGLDGLTFLSLKRNRISDGGLAFLEKYRRLNQLVLEEAAVTDDGLVHIQGLTRLRHLRLSKGRITDAGLSCLKNLTALRTLGLAGTQVSDEGLSNLEGLPNLEVVYLDGTRVTDRGVDHLCELVALREIGLCGTEVTSAGVARIRDALPSCFILWP